MSLEGLNKVEPNGAAINKGILVSACLYASGCITPAICRHQTAFESGRQQALDGHSISYAAGDVCEDPKDYDQFRRGFSSGYKSGIDELCSVGFVRTLGKNQGQNGDRSEFPEARFSACQSSITSLKTAFQEGYQDGLSEFCSVDNAGKEGYATGFADRDLDSEISQRFGRCTPALQAELSETYRAQFLIGRRAFCEPDNQKSVLARNARSHRRLELAAAQKRCLSLYPEFRASYESIFLSERADHERATCSFQVGIEAGQRDARHAVTPAPGFPEFCGDKTHSTYVQGYQEGFRLEKALVCQLDAASGQGEADARAGMSSSPERHMNTHLCPADLRAQYRVLYLQGYTIEKGSRRSEHSPTTPSCGRIDPFAGRAGRFLKIRAGTQNLLWPNGKTFVYNHKGFSDHGTIYYPSGEPMLEPKPGQNGSFATFWPNGKKLEEYRINGESELWLPSGQKWRDSPNWRLPSFGNSEQTASAVRAVEGDVHVKVTLDDRKKRYDLVAETRLARGVIRYGFHSSNKVLWIEECSL